MVFLGLLLSEPQNFPADENPVFLPENPPDHVWVIFSLPLSETRHQPLHPPLPDISGHYLACDIE